MLFLAGDRAGVASDAAVLVDYESVAHTLFPVRNHDADDGTPGPW
jgi:hypothetical protein